MMDDHKETNELNLHVSVIDTSQMQCKGEIFHKDMYMMEWKKLWI